MSKHLEAPGSAKWPRDVTTTDGDGYGVAGYVDSRNGFGALLRSTYVCRVTYDTSAETWAVNASVF